MRALSSLAHPFGMEIGPQRRLRSHLCIALEGDTWLSRRKCLCVLRPPLIDDGFFGRVSDRVISTVRGPGWLWQARPIRCGPRRTGLLPSTASRTLDPSVAEWTIVSSRMRRTDFTSVSAMRPNARCRRSSDMLLYDPAVPLDAMHASLFTRPNVTQIAHAAYGISIASKLLAFWISSKAVADLGRRGRLNVESFARCRTCGRDHRPYLRSLLKTPLEQDRAKLFILDAMCLGNEAHLCPAVSPRPSKTNRGRQSRLRNAVGGRRWTPDQDKGRPKVG